MVLIQFFEVYNKEDEKVLGHLDRVFPIRIDHVWGWYCHATCDQSYRLKTPLD